MKKLIRKLWDFIPKYVIIPLVVVFTYQSTVYFGSKLINHSLTHYSLETPLDGMISIIPAFSIIYLGCYVFWVFNYMIVGKINKEYFYTFVTNIFINYTVCAIIFILIPTSIERPENFSVTSFSTMLMKYVYNSDTPNNLFPSMHCLISWLCYIGIRGKKEIPKWYQYTSLIIAILVCISTVAIKQHYVVDIFAGIIIAEVVFFLTKRSTVWKPVYRFFEGVNRRFALE